MSFLLTTPRTVIAFGLRSSTVDDLRPTLLDGVAERVELLPADDVGDALDDRDDVGCLLVGDETADPVDVCERIRTIDDRRPVVALVEGGDESLAHRFLRAGGDEYVPQTAGPDAVRSAVDRAFEFYEQRRYEHANSQMFESLLQRAGISLYAKDVEGRYLRQSVVPGADNPEDVIGKTDPEIYADDPETAQKWYEDDMSVVERDEGIFEQEERLDTDGGEHWSRTTKIPWHVDGELEGLLGISFDITEYVEYRYRLEEYRDRFEKFAESVTHDLHTPLQVASGNLELARETGDEEAIARVEGALDRIEEMLSDLSDVATEEQRTLSRSRVADRSYETVSLHPIEVSYLVDEVWTVLDTDGATLDNDLPEESLIYGPESALRTVVENLLKNAVRHAGPGAHVRVGHVPDGGFYVEDDGPGIDPGVRDDIFEEGVTTAEDGSGTGLAIVSDIADSQGWMVDVTQGELGGARFEISNCLFVTTDRLLEPTGEPEALDRRTVVGDVDVDTSATFEEESGRWTVTGGGTNIWQATNEFYFVHATLDGPVTIQGRVVDLEEVGEYSKAGFMIRDALDEGSTYGYTGVIPDARTEALWRTARGEDGVTQFVERDEETPKRWFRVDRVGQRITVAVSEDADDWTPVNERHVDLTDPVHVGIVVCSFRPNTSCTAVFEDVALHRLDPDDGIDERAGTE